MTIAYLYPDRYEILYGNLHSWNYAFFSESVYYKCSKYTYQQSCYSRILEAPKYFFQMHSDYSLYFSPGPLLSEFPCCI